MNEDTNLQEYQLGIPFEYLTVEARKKVVQTITPKASTHILLFQNENHKRVVKRDDLFELIVRLAQNFSWIQSPCCLLDVERYAEQLNIPWSSTVWSIGRVRQECKDKLLPLVARHSSYPRILKKLRKEYPHLKR